MIIYLDSDFKCHTENDGTLREIETDFFEGKCAEYIEGYRYVPEGETWTDESGSTFKGLMISPCRKYSEIEEIQNAVDDAQNKADEELAALIEEIYIEDLGVIYYV